MIHGGEADETEDISGIERRGPLEQAAGRRKAAQR